MPIVSGGLLVSEVIDECRQVYLNDANAQIYTNTLMLPFVKTAYQELEDRLVAAGLTYIQEESSVFDIAAGSTVITAPPADMIMPVWVGERPNGSTEPFTTMLNKRWPPELTKGDCLDYWVWEEGAIKFLGANTDREVKLRYHKALSSLTSTSSVIALPNSKNYLSQKASSLAAKFIGGNSELSMDLETRAALSIGLLVSANVKEAQGRGVRARPFRSFRARR